AATLALDPVPLCCGAPFRGTLTATTGRPIELQAVRVALYVDAGATVSSGEKESILLWQGRLHGPGLFGAAEEVTLPVEGTLPVTWLPTVELPHGRSSARLEITLARAWAPDVHLTRDVAVCSTTEL
ncbi:MAG TPA: hypothetical protein VFW92_10790, partial [Candidatus Limnocylindrales bacterium]|nr:hypothetical protein [Candidatus Limnocylindrales bacterium]